MERYETAEANCFAKLARLPFKIIDFLVWFILFIFLIFVIYYWDVACSFSYGNKIPNVIFQIHDVLILKVIEWKYLFSISYWLFYFAIHSFLMHHRLNRKVTFIVCYYSCLILPWIFIFYYLYSNFSREP